MDSQDDDLDELLSELSTTLSALQEELAEEDGPSRSRSSTRGQLPSPGRFLRFTEEYTIPTLISLLETHIRALELLQGLLRLVNGREDRGDRSSSVVGNRRVRNTGRRTLDALDGALSDLQGALEGEPPDGEANSLLNDARSLSEEIDSRLSEPGNAESGAENGETDERTDDGAIRIDVEGPDTETDDSGVDVDEELDTIKRELQDDDDDPDES